MILHFQKYQGTGNDFIMLNNVHHTYRLTTSLIKKLCDRRFGIGADGLILLQKSTEADFEMIYYNADGNESSMCGNGGRCLVAFAMDQIQAEKQGIFKAIDGLHHYTILPNGNICISMKDVLSIQVYETYTELNTGSPHYVCFENDIAQLDMKREGALIRYSPIYKDEGINVNFVEIINEQRLFVRTYERGVEDETLSCGTGVTAAAIASVGNRTGEFSIEIKTLGGLLSVSFTKSTPNTASDIQLTGPANFIFRGEISLATLS
jgi:diaminopimelate epimerase